MKVSEIITYLGHIKAELNKFNRASVYVGVSPNNDHLTMIALVQEYGKHIAAKNYPYLVIPTSGAQGRKASQIPGLYKRGMTLGYNDDSAPGGYVVCFVLRKSVDIPARPFLRSTFNHNEYRWYNLTVMNAQKVANGVISADDALKIIAENVKNDIKETIISMKIPQNAPLTAERKGKDDPLIDKGNLLNSIQVFITYDRQ